MDIENKIDEYLIKEDISSLIDIAIFMEEDNFVDENKAKDVKNVLQKIGIDIEKKDEGIFGKLKKPETREFFKYLLKAFIGDKEAKQKIKEMSKGVVSKGDIINILLKLDSLTLHLLSGPIKILALLTGWQIVGVKKKVENMTTRVKKAIEVLVNLSTSLAGKEKKQVVNFVGNLKRLENKIEEV